MHHCELVDGLGGLDGYRPLLATLHTPLNQRPRLAYGGAM